MKKIKLNRILLLLGIGTLIFGFSKINLENNDLLNYEMWSNKKESLGRGPRPLLDSTKIEKIGDVIYATTGEGLFEESDPWLYPPGTNLLPNIYTNAYDSKGNEMVNTLPSTPTVPYNLHHGTPVVTNIDQTSPTDDLQDIFDFLMDTTTTKKFPSNLKDIQKCLQFGIDILEGNPIKDKEYSTFPLLHYNGPEKIKKVEKLEQPDIVNGDTIWYNVDATQLWYDSHIESNIGQLDLTEVWDKPWMVTYYVKVLNRGEDDFSPFAIFKDYNYDQETGQFRTKDTIPSIPHIGMDQSFYPMQDGTQTVFKIKMPPAKYYNLVYTWGWRMHPPRIQVMEDRNKHFPDPSNNNKITRLDSFEINVFGPEPTKNDATKKAAIAKISNLSPAKRVWNTFTALQTSLSASDNYGSIVRNQITDARDAFFAWKDRTHLPDTSLMDPDADLTLLYVNNTIYGGFRDHGTINFPKWRTRGDSLRVTIKNGDYFWHAYQNVDFGGARGWENAYKSAVRVGGSGCWFTFGRAYWWKNLGKNFLRLPPAEQNSLDPTVSKLHITFNYEPSRRLRFYQFDPFHHDVAIFSVH
jgi:hypothetical protein